MIRYLREEVWPRIPTLRMRSANRMSLDRLLNRQFARLNAGLVLDVGSKGAPYATAIPHTRLVTLDVDPSRKPDICCDVHELEWEGDYFDTIVALEVLEHLQDPARAINQIRRVLKVGGVFILSTRFLCRYHPDPEDHYRFTWDSLRHLCCEFSEVEVFHHGNRAQVIWEIINAGGRSRVLLNLLNPLVARLESTRTRFPLGFVVWARK